MTTEVETLPQMDRAKPKLGEELPVFCERCGYSLHGLPMTRCEHCTILQFHCPECGHHQPINTLRPAAQTLLGRIRGGWLMMVVFFKLNLFGWGLFAWVAMGVEMSYTYNWVATQQVASQTTNYQPVYGPMPLMWESALAFGLFGLGSGMVWRMALLRFKRGWAVGLVMATVIIGCIALGVLIRHIDRNQPMPTVYTSDFVTLNVIAFLGLVLGATIVWPLWTLLARAFLPAGTARQLLNWQTSLSNDVSALSRPQEP